MASRAEVKRKSTPLPFTLPGPCTPLPVEPGAARARRISPMNHQEIIAYNLRGDGHEFTEFETAQADRVAKTRAVIQHIVDTERTTDDGLVLPTKIVEPGCSTGDISGFFAEQFEVVGIDVTPGAAEAAARKWPEMEVRNLEVETVEPIECDILVMCEFLEHISHPDQFVRAWMPRAKYVIISHPLVGDGGDPEVGHLWAYYPVDFANWFPAGGHELRQAWEFPMGYRMVIGWSARL